MDTRATANTSEYMSVRQAADMLDMDPRTVRDLMVQCLLETDDDVLRVRSEPITQTAKWHRPKDLARALGVSAFWIRQRIHSGDIEATRFGKMWRISDESFQQARTHA